MLFVQPSRGGSPASLYQRPYPEDVFTLFAEEYVQQIKNGRKLLEFPVKSPPFDVQYCKKMAYVKVGSYR